MKKFYSIFPLFLLTACSKKVSDMSGWEILGLAAVILIPIALWSMEVKRLLAMKEKDTEEKTEKKEREEEKRKRKNR